MELQEKEDKEENMQKSWLKRTFRKKVPKNLDFRSVYSRSKTF